MKYSSQKDCVFAAVCVVLATVNIEPKAGLIARKHITEDMRKDVIAMVYEDFKEGNVLLKTQYTDEELMKYIPGMISNHLRKDKRLNGGEKYEAKNPGSMTGNKDPKIKETRKLLKQLKAANAPAEAIAKTESVLEGLVTEWKAKNGKSVEINRDQLPPELIELYEKSVNG